MKFAALCAFNILHPLNREASTGNRNPMNKSYPPLDNVCKNIFPFTLACPSFVYPAGYVDNIRHLAPFVDEIQLLFFESRPAHNLPSRQLIKELADVAGDEAITYNVHLPSDIHLGHTDPMQRRRDAEVLRHVMARCAPLSPSTFTLHLNRNPDMAMGHWQTHLAEALQRMLTSGINSRRISVETLDYPLEWVAPVIAALDLSVCMDMGHLMVHGVDLATFYKDWRKRITTIHLHGVDRARDHLPLNRLSDQQMYTVLEILRPFAGVVSLEVYSHPALNASMTHLLDQWPK